MDTKKQNMNLFNTIIMTARSSNAQVKGGILNGDEYVQQIIKYT